MGKTVKASAKPVTVFAQMCALFEQGLGYEDVAVILKLNKAHVRSFMFNHWVKK